MSTLDAAVNIHDAKTHLSRLIEQVRAGSPVVIAKAGKPLVRMVSVDAPIATRRMGFLVGEIAVPDDFDRMGGTEIETLFNGLA